MPIINLRINISSIPVSDVRKPPARLATHYKMEKKSIGWCVRVDKNSSKLTAIPRVPSFPMGNVMWWIGHFISQWFIAFE